ncbi:HD domain-containing protein [Paractinoplanes brasiliensis]|uniref:HD domain-containing protein n=1 Tax=Paractinoplanes brasiliensis TaxID=52695 RepID=A0A4R6JRG2_9ACTN|nr:HD domain-containing protein [Actinoplanes brasiliensis]TDO39009.1 HD domain-containing protein [Actinoplanes brasiliensis]GID33344.1 hypothetical protein Abr02nite_83270 [Actinoplanes brasiliensis]
MTSLTPPRHPLVERALTTARHWCSGKIIDDRPALAHAARVAVTIGEHHPAAGPRVIAAALLHDAPEFAPAPRDLDRFLTARFGDEVRRLIRGMQTEHDALDRMEPILLDTRDAPLVLLSTADKIVALNSLLRRAHLAGDVLNFFAVRKPLIDLLDHFRACQQATLGAVPPTMSTALADILNTLDTATSSLRTSG